MIRETPHFMLDKIIVKDNGTERELPIEQGLKIVQKLDDGSLSLVLYILPAAPSAAYSCYFKTAGDAFQNAVTSWELYTEIVELLDVGFDKVQLAIEQAEATALYNDYIKNN